MRILFCNCPAFTTLRYPSIIYYRNYVVFNAARWTAFRWFSELFKWARNLQTILSFVCEWKILLMCQRKKYEQYFQEVLITLQKLPGLHNKLNNKDVLISFASYLSSLQSNAFLVFLTSSCIDPQGRPTITSCSDNYFCTDCPSVRPSPFFKVPSVQTFESQLKNHSQPGLCTGRVDHWWLIPLFHKQQRATFGGLSSLGFFTSQATADPRDPFEKSSARSELWAGRSSFGWVVVIQVDKYMAS